MSHAGFVYATPSSFGSIIGFHTLFLPPSPSSDPTLSAMIAVSVQVAAGSAGTKQIVLIDTVDRLNATAVSGGEVVDPIIVEIESDTLGIISIDPCTPWLQHSSDAELCTIEDMAVGDVNQDGNADLVFLLKSLGNGASLVVASGPFVTSEAPSLSVSTFSTTVGALIKAGRSVSVVGGTASPNAGSIVVGAPTAGNGNATGTVLLLRSASLGHSVTGQYSRFFPSPTEGVDFGIKTLTCDVDGDSVDDLVIAAPAQAGNDKMSGGYVVVYRGLNNTFDSTQSVKTPVLGGDIVVGKEVAYGDVNGDGKDDLIVGSRRPDETSESGWVDVASASMFASWTDPMVELWARIRAAPSVAGYESFAATQGAVVVGSPFADQGAGGVFVYSGDSTMPNTTILTAPIPGCQVGWTVAITSTMVAATVSSCDTILDRGVLVFDTSSLTASATSTGDAATTTGATSPVLGTTVQDTASTSHPSTTSAPVPLGIAAVDDSTADSPVAHIAALAATLTGILFFLAFAALVRQRRSRTRAKHVATGAPPHRSGRISRGVSTSRVGRSRRASLPIAQTKSPVTAYGETSLAVPGEAKDAGTTPLYAETSLYPMPVRPPGSAPRF